VIHVESTQFLGFY